MRTLTSVPLLAVIGIVLGSPAEAFEMNGSWATASSACGQVFSKKDGAISFQRDSDQYGGGFIVDGDKIRGQMQTCTITRHRQEGNVIHLLAKCADDIMLSNVELSAKIVDDNTIARIFAGMPEFTLGYSRCPK